MCITILDIIPTAWYTISTKVEKLNPNKQKNMTKTNGRIEEYQKIIDIAEDLFQKDDEFERGHLSSILLIARELIRLERKKF